MSLTEPASRLNQRLAMWLLGLGLIASLGSVPVSRADHELSQDYRSLDVPGDLRKAIELSEAFAHGSGATAILVALVLATWPPRPGVWRAVIMTASSGITANVLKILFTRARPYTYDQGTSAQASDVTGWQFLGEVASGTQVSAAFRRVTRLPLGGWRSA